MTEHHALPIYQIINTDIKVPSYYVTLYVPTYPLLIEKFGNNGKNKITFTFIQSMRFESKQKQSKDTAKYITSEKFTFYLNFEASTKLFVDNFVIKWVI